MMIIAVNGFSRSFAIGKIADGQAATQDFDLSQGATVICRIRDLSKPYEGPVSLVQGQDSVVLDSLSAYKTVVTKAIVSTILTNGIAELPGVPPGEYTLVGMLYPSRENKERAVLVSRPVTVEDESTIEVML